MIRQWHRKGYAIGLALLVGVMALLTGCGRGKAHGQWSQVPTMRQDAFFGLHFVSPQHGFLVGWDGFSEWKTEGWSVIQSNDGGLTWTPLLHQQEMKIRKAYFVTPEAGWAITIRNDILHTEDGGGQWTLQRAAGVVKARNDALPEKKRQFEIPEAIDRLLFLDPKTGWAWGGGRQQAGFSMPGPHSATAGRLS